MSYDDGMIDGERYFIEYRFDYQRKIRHAVMTFMGYTRNGDLEFNARPFAGTQTLPKSALISYERRDKSVAHYIS